MVAVSIRTIGTGPWTRVFITEAQDLLDAERALGFEIESGAHDPGAGVFPFQLMDARADSATVYELAIVLRDDRILTVEPGGGIPFLQDVEARLQLDEHRAGSPFTVCFALVQAGYVAVGRSLAMIEGDIRSVHQSMARLDVDQVAVKSVGVSDLPQVSAHLIDIDRAISHASYTVGRLVQLARLLRHEASNQEAAERSRLNDLVQQGQALERRLEFIVDRHRFHAQGSSQQISTSDLNVIKVFTVLWAILIPGTTLINWYGQNFEFMPELSWPYTSWVQIAGVFLLAALPIYVIKRAGQLR